ncbi:hypothetical protein ACHAPU_000711 [Fusarium lateritium]
MSSRGLLGLATELIIRIIDLADPSSHLDLACSCRQLLNCSQGVLHQHQEAHQRLAVISDLDPSTIPTLLRSASGINSPIDAWHVRHIEIWGSRWTWKEWRPWRIRPESREPAVPRDKRRHAFEKSQPLEWSIPRWELAHYLKIMQDRLGLTEQLVDLARSELDLGRDGAMQMLLIALCPRLKSLKYMYNKHDKVECRRCLYWLTYVMGKAWMSGSWPPGLRSLREASVGVRSDTWLDCDLCDLWYTRSCFRGLLKLPNLKALYFRGLRPQDRPADDRDCDRDNNTGIRHISESPLTARLRHAADHLPSRCSAVEHLYLATVYDHDTVQKGLGRAPRALKTYTLHGGDMAYSPSSEFDSLLDFMVAFQIDTLESIMIYDAHLFRSDIWTLYRLQGKIEVHDCPQLRQIHIQVTDLILHSFYDFPGGVALLKDLWAFPDCRQTCIDLVTGLFPESLEVLVLGCLEADFSDDDVSTKMAEGVLIGMIQSKEFPHLKAIYFDQSEDGDDCLFPGLVEVGRQAGIDIHVKGHPYAPRHQIEFPMQPRATSHLRSGQTLPSNFDPFWGCWASNTEETQLVEDADGVSSDDGVQGVDDDDDTDDDRADYDPFS